MILRPSVLCPIDFSVGSRGALRYAAVIAGYLGARLTVLAIDDPLLIEAAEFAESPASLRQQTLQEMRKFGAAAFGGTQLSGADVQLEITTGKPASEILRHARDSRCDLIVMGSHGATGFRKLFFGSTTERVLRETPVPVLITPAADGGPIGPADVQRVVRRILVPVDLTAATANQLLVTRTVAEALNVPLLLLHVVEPVRTLVTGQPRQPKIDTERRHRAERQLEEAAAKMPAVLKPEVLVTYGEPAEEIAKVAHDRDAGLIILGLHSSPVLGPRMGSVTYRVLCLAHRLVLALPPQPAPAVRFDIGETFARTDGPTASV
jgi:nucleotide-binding universal stress UspA family protein